MITTRFTSIDLNSWYIIGTPESHTHKVAECFPYAGFFASMYVFFCSIRIQNVGVDPERDRRRRRMEILVSNIELQEA